MNTSLISLYSRAYALLGNLTPIPADCGELCDAKCCAGDQNSGMILFPGEKAFLSRADFLKFQKRDVDAFPVDFAVCRGKCVRRLRPISCRIFPLAPLWDGKDLKIIPDPRAAYICPLLQADEYILPEFKKAVHDAFSLLLENAEFSEFLIHYSNMLRSYMKFTGNV